MVKMLLLRTAGRTADVARELARRRADLVGHARGSLEQHLVGVHDTLQRWGQPERVRPRRDRPAAPPMVRSLWTASRHRRGTAVISIRMRPRRSIGIFSPRRAYSSTSSAQR